MKIKISKKQLVSILIPLLFAVLSCTVLARMVPKSNFIESTLESVEDSKTTVLDFTGASLAVSLAVSALPNDFASPIANSITDMNKYFVLILIALFVERLILVIGVKMSFLFVIPLSCVLFVLGFSLRKEKITVFAQKTAILGLALFLVVPCSVKFTNYVGTEYLAYVEETIAETNGGADKINDEIEDGSEGTTLFDKLSDTFKTVINGASDLLSYFKDIIKKCMNSIVILIVTNFIMPVVTLLIFRWLLKELFRIIIPTVQPINKGLESRL